MSRTGITLLLLLLPFTMLKAQLVINEASNKNYKQLIDEDGETNDWIELYNSADTELDLSGWALTDNRKNPVMWPFGNMVVPPKGFLLINASGKNRNQLEEIIRWESAVLPTDLFNYIVPDKDTPVDWFTLGFDDSSWTKGKAGFGYGDNDDQTILSQNTVSVFIRKKFNIPDTSAILGAIFHIDYDDGFIAYLNGVEIARANMVGYPEWNSSATQNHEATMYLGGLPEAFQIDIETLRSIIVEGENVLCVQGHNVEANSTDFSLIPFLSFSLKEGRSFFQQSPSWFVTNSASQLHANFKISSEGEKIFISHDSTLVDSVKVPSLQLDHSYGRITDGANQWGYFTASTPGKSNNSSAANTEGYTLKPGFNYEAGYYNTSIDVAISSFEPNSTIRYTIDGSEPTSSSALYNSPIRISATKCLKAKCFSTRKLPGETTTATFLINEEYTIPVLSVTTNNSNLYGQEGIFDNYNETWNIPAYAEYFDKKKLLAFSLNTGMQIDGGAGGSRSNPQHSFRLEPGNSTFGDGDLKYKLMPRRPNRNNFPSFYLRNGSNQYLTLPYKDALQVTALGRNTYTYYSAYHPVVVYINGGYFGVYELREKINKDFLEDNYGMDTDSLDFLGMSYFWGTTHNGDRFYAIEGSLDPYVADLERFRKLSYQSENYLAEVDKFLDIKSYTDYIIAENWVGNNDWPDNNIKVFRCKGTNYRWQWALNDLEWALMPNYWTTAEFDHFDYMQGYGEEHNFTGFWMQMMKNSTYKAYFINRYADLMNTNYQFSVVGRLENELFNEIYPEIDGEFARWRSSANMANQLNTFTRNHQIFRSELEKRSNVVRDQIQSHYGLSNQVTVTLDVEPAGAGSIQISTIIPANYPWEGIYFTNIPVTVTALPNPGYRFSKWNSVKFFTDSYNAVQTGKFNGTKANLKAFFEPDKSVDVGVVISEINYKTGTSLDSPDWIELCNLSPDEVNLKGWQFTDDDTSHIFTFDRDLVLGSNQRIVVANNYSKFKSLYPSVMLFPGEFDFGLGSPDDKIELFDSNKQKVVSINYSDTYPWALSEDFSGRTLELRTPGKELDQPLAWFRGCIGGSPGRAYQPCNEIITSSPEPIVERKFDVRVYPVPARDFVSVELFIGEEPGNCAARLYNFTGSLVKSIPLDNAMIGWNRLHLPLDDLQGSLFFLKIATSTNEKTVKVIKLER